jgi:LPPG:FO 2-phospho-L-lactate transferase
LITVLAGGTGSAKLVRGLAAVTDDLTIISNVGDNIWLHGLYVCPDIDTVIYALAGILDARRGWGIRGDTFNFLKEIRRHGSPAWFSLGDRDMAVHVLRTRMLREGKTLSEITDIIRKQLGISTRIIPSTDDPLATSIVTDEGKMHLQEFWVKNRARPKIERLYYEGSSSAVPNEKALAAIRRSKAVIIATANPVSSIGPILAVKGFREALAAQRHKVIAVSPIIGQNAISGPAVKYMKACGIENSPEGVARYYGSSLGKMVIAESDHRMAEDIEKLGIRVFETDIMMKGRQSEKRLARYLVSGLREK